MQTLQMLRHVALTLCSHSACCSCLSFTRHLKLSACLWMSGRSGQQNRALQSQPDAGRGRHSQGRNAQLAEAAAERHLRSSIKMLLSGPKVARELLQQALSMAAEQGMLRLQAEVLADLVEVHHNFVRCVHRR